MRDEISLIRDWLIRISKQDSLKQVNILHAYMCEQNVELNPVLCCYLVPLLIECGSLPDAQHVFHRLSPLDCNAYLWNSLVIGHAHHGDPHVALYLYHRMQQDLPHIQPNRYAYLALLNMCATLKAQQHGREIHADIVKRGLDEYIYGGSAVIGNTLVDMYGKCGCLPEAQQVFTTLPAQNAISWTALIAGYVDNGLSEEAENFLHQMCALGGLHDHVTLICCLKACGITESLETVRELHTEISRRGLDMKLSIGNTLVDVYGKCNALADACHVFDGLLLHDAVSWAAMIAAYTERGLGEEVVNCLEKMQQEGVAADSVIFMGCVKAASLIGTLETGWKFHAEIIKRGLEKDLLVGSTLAHSYSKFGLVNETQWIFNSLPIQNAVSWNALIVAYAEGGLCEEVRNCLWEMQMHGISPDSISIACCLKACGTLSMLETGRELHAEVTKIGLEKETSIGSLLVMLYTNCGLTMERQAVFDKLLVQCPESSAALISLYIEDGYEEVGRCFRLMQSAKVVPHSATLLYGLKVCCSLGALGTGQEVHAEITKRGLDGEEHICSMLIEMYGNCGLIAEGQHILDRLPMQGVTVWTALIKAYGENSVANKALQCFEDMQKQGNKPDSMSFTCALAACSHASLVSEGYELVRHMLEVHRIEPTYEHCSCLMNLFVRSGHLNEAEKMTIGLQCRWSAINVRTVLSACHLYGNMGLGERCFERTLEGNCEGA